MDLGLKGKNAIITGGSHGIGLAVAELLASEGCNIVLLARNVDKLEAAQKRVRKYNVDCHIIPVDVLDKSQIEDSFKVLKSILTDIHILINNVGGGGRWGIDDFEQNPDHVWQEVYDKNAVSTMLYTRFSLPYMKRYNWGRVITITSTLGKQAGGRPWFNMAKTAQTTLMKNLSLDKKLVRHNITFNSVAPGCIMIPDTGWAEEKERNPSDFDRFVDDRFPLGRMGEPEEVAFSVVMLCSEKASLISGASLSVDGGESYVF